MFIIIGKVYQLNRHCLISLDPYEESKYYVLRNHDLLIIGIPMILCLIIEERKDAQILKTLISPYPTKKAGSSLEG